MSPRVSVLMAVHNCEPYLREAVDSILAQTFTDFEFIVVDDGSTDRSADVIASYSDPRIIFVRNDKNLGLTASLNRGLELARGEYVARMDGDDVSLPERLARQVAFMDANPGVGACGTWATDIDEAGRVKGGRETPTGDELDNFYWRVSLIHPSAMFRFDRRRGPRYNPEVRYSQDYDLWLRVAAVSRLSNLPEHLLLYRVHGGSVTASNAENQARSSYEAFCRHAGGRVVSYEAFRALMRHTHDLDPVRQAVAKFRLARGIRKPYRVFFGDDVEYARHWLRARGIGRANPVAWALRAFRAVRRRVGVYVP